MASSSVISNDTMAGILWTGAQCALPSQSTTTDVVVDEGYQRNVPSHAHSSMHSLALSATSFQPNEPVIKSELTWSPDFRLSRPSTVPPRPIPTLTSPEVAISASQHNTYNNRRQDVPDFSVNTSASYNPSTATRSNAYSQLRTAGSSSTHVLTQPYQRPRTSTKVFSTSDLLAHYGLPSILPPAPSTAPRTQPVIQTPQRKAIPDFSTDFQSLAANYINMLSQRPDNTMTADSTSPVQTVSPTDLQAALPDERTMQDLVDIITQGSGLPLSPVSPILQTPELEPPSPEFALTPDFFSSPSFTPHDDFLTTPVMGEVDEMEMYTGFADVPLFPDYMDDMYMEQEKQLAAPLPVVPSTNAKLYTMTPTSPMLQSFSPSLPSVNPASIYPSPRFPSTQSSFPSPAPAAPTRRKSSATGTRKGVTPEALVPLDAPTQPRKYVIPSATSRKEVPSVFAKKRARSQAFGDEEDELAEEPLRPGATEKEQIEYKRRQNTVAARRSRKRKLLHQQYLEERIEVLAKSRETWKTRASICQQMLIAHGIPAPQFEDDDDDDENKE